jgi:hypothetical protein
MDFLDTRRKLEKMETSYPEIKEVLDSVLDSLTIVEKGSNKQVDSNFLNELIALKGVGKISAENIVKIYPTRDSLVNEIKVNKYLPFRKDICLVLKARYGSI